MIDIAGEKIKKAALKKIKSREKLPAFKNNSLDFNSSRF